MNNADNTAGSTYSNRESVEKETCGCGNSCGCSDNIDTREALSSSSDQTFCSCGSECECNN